MMDHSFEVLGDRQTAQGNGAVRVNRTPAEHIAVSLEIALFPPQWADCFVSADIPPSEVAALLLRAVQVEQ
jgi:hypothetical protein